MASTQYIDNEFSARFFSDVLQLYPQSSNQYRCTGIPDVHYSQLGVLRCLSSSTTGQGFLQFHADHGIASIEPDHFFKAIQSPRRLANITSPNGLLAGVMKGRIPDPYAQCKELDGWDIYAVDGHYHHAACFDKKSKNSKGEPRAVATGHFFRMNMRDHHMGCLGMAKPKDGKKKAHDMTVIKRGGAGELRNGAPTGRKVMLVWDKACIDYRHWHAPKHNSGVYFITMEKSNSAAEICSTDLLDRDDPRNAGVVSDHLVGTSNGVLIRRIVYTNPEDGVTYTYITNDHTLPAYQIVLLYKHRWDIEKIFHQFKSKMGERKSWGSSDEAKQSHAIFECLAHNLLLLFEQYLRLSEGPRDELEEKRQLGRGRDGAAASAAAGIIRTAVGKGSIDNIHHSQPLHPH